MIFSTYKLTFHSPLHISKGKLNSYESSADVIHSDTLKAALFVCAKQLFGVDIAKKLHDKTVISSAFPFDTEGGYWLPKPISFTFGDLETPDNRKDLKKIKYFTIGQYQAILSGKLPTLDNTLSQPEIWQRETSQRVWINGNPEQSTPFYLERLYPKSSDSGLYFIIDNEREVLNEEEKQQFEASLRLLGDNGIGLQRGLGNGQFSIAKGSFSIELPQNATQWVSLSLYRPESKEQIEGIIENSVYQFVKRGGWLNAPESDEHLTIRKRSVMMFTEGSVFAFGEEPIEGKIEDLKPDYPIGHSVWRDGRSIFLPIF